MSRRTNIRTKTTHEALYRSAIEHIVGCEDISWLNNADIIQLSDSAKLIASIFNVADSQVCNDLDAEQRRAMSLREAESMSISDETAAPKTIIVVEIYDGCNFGEVAERRFAYNMTAATEWAERECEKLNAADPEFKGWRYAANSGNIID